MKDGLAILMRLSPGSSNSRAWTKAASDQAVADGSAARGQNDLALAAEPKCLDLLPTDRIDDHFNAGLRQAAEQKIAKLKAKSFR